MEGTGFASRLRAIRQGRLIRSGPEIGVRELARRAGMSSATVSQIENGKVWRDKFPPLDDVRKLAKGLKVSIEQLVGDDDTPVPPPDPETERLINLGRGVLQLVREHDADYRANVDALEAGLRRNADFMALNPEPAFIRELAEHMENARRGQ